MKKIKLNKGKFAIIDDDDYERVSKKIWWCEVKKNKKAIYACNSLYIKEKQRVTTLRMHRFIMGAKKGVQIDHINGNGLDNRKSNLRFCTNSQNRRNTSVSKKKAGSNFKGVDFKNGLWRSRITIDKKQIHLGYFKNEIDAAKNYEEAAKKLFGNFYKINLESESV